jgi:DNA primase
MRNTVVEQIKDRLSITDVLASYITLQQSGSQFKARCPFHNEKTPSFSVSPDKGLYYCFGCGAKGDIFSFVEKFEGLDFSGALKLLADRAGVPLERESLDERDLLYSFLSDQM